MKSEKSKPIGILIGNFFVSVIVMGMLLTLLAVSGCDEAQNMMKPAVSEPADTPPAMVGDMKKPEEQGNTDVASRIPAEEPKEEEQEKTPAEPTPPADTTPPTVVEVAWYGDFLMTQPLTADSTVRPGDTVYTVVVFSEPMRYVVADDKSARPALFIVTDGKTKRYRMLTNKTDIQSGEAQPFQRGTDDYFCQYTIPADTVGTIALRVGSATADTAGNRVAEASEHVAPFAVTAPAVAKPIPPPQLPDLTRREPTPLERAEEIAHNIIHLQTYNSVYRDYEENINMISRETGLDYVTFIYDILYNEIYLDERPEEIGKEWFWHDLAVEYLRLGFLYPDASEEELLVHFRQSVKDGRVEVTRDKSLFLQKRKEQMTYLRENIQDLHPVRFAIFDREIAALKQRKADPSFDIVAEWDTIFREEAGLTFDFVHNTLMGIYIQENPGDQKILDTGIYRYSFLIYRYLLHKRTYQEESEEQILERIREDVAGYGSVFIELEDPLETY